MAAVIHSNAVIFVIYSCFVDAPFVCVCVFCFCFVVVFCPGFMRLFVVSFLI